MIEGFMEIVLVHLGFVDQRKGDKNTRPDD